MVMSAFALGAMSAPGSARAGMLFTGSSGSLSASADFELSGNSLTVTLTNTSPSDVLVPGDVLTGVFFNTVHSLTPVSASLNGSSVYDGSIVHDVGEGWQYKAFSGGVAQGKNSGISAAGLGLFGPSGNFYTPAVKLGGIDYGIVSAGDNPLTGNGGISGHGPLIKNSIVFTLTAAQGFVLTDLGNSVVFQYGTSLTETHVTSVPPITGLNQPPAVPEPSSIAISVTAIALVSCWRRYRA
jgi:hypothetical protein